MHKKDIRTGGKKLGEAEKALIMLHGRGAPAEDILALSSHLSVKDFALLAPQATNYTWYPYSFLAPVERNEPWLSSAIDLLHQLVHDVNTAGIGAENIFLCGFSQGACLALEFATRHAKKWGGVVAFTGGLIGDQIYPQRYQGDFDGAHVLIASGDPDPHVPVGRVHETTGLLRGMRAQVTEKIYPDMGHTIIAEEIALANTWVFGAGDSKQKTPG